MVKETRKQFNVRFTDEEKKRINDFAEAKGEKMSTFIRRNILLVIENK